MLLLLAINPFINIIKWLSQKKMTVHHFILWYVVIHSLHIYII